MFCAQALTAYSRRMPREEKIGVSPSLLTPLRAVQVEENEKEKQNSHAFFYSSENKLTF
jgi:hypothetical protein